MHVRKARKLLKRFPRYGQKIFMNVVTDDESWIYYFEPHRKISKEDLYCQNDYRCKKVMHAIFFTSKGLAIQVFIPKGKSMITRFYRK